MMALQLNIISIDWTNCNSEKWAQSLHCVLGVEIETASEAVKNKVQEKPDCSFRFYRFWWLQQAADSRFVWPGPLIETMGYGGRFCCKRNGQLYYLIAILFLVGTFLIDVGVVGQHIANDEQHCKHQHPTADEVSVFTILVFLLIIIILIRFDFIEWKSALRAEIAIRRHRMKKWATQRGNDRHFIKCVETVIVHIQWKSMVCFAARCDACFPYLFSSLR